MVALVILWNYRFPQATPFQDISCRNFVDIVYNYWNGPIKLLEKVNQEVDLINNEGALFMGIHYDYKAIKLWKKRLKEKHVLSRRAKRSSATLKYRARKYAWY